MKIIIDKDIPYAKELFGSITTKLYLVNGRNISRTLLMTVDVLIIRSVTIVNEELLKHTPVKFVGSVTSGYDHVDIHWLKKNDIYFCAAIGSNAISVSEYIFSSLLLYAEYNSFNLKDKVVGIIGVGNIGKYLNLCLRTWGVSTLLCDPPRERIELDKYNKNKFYSLEYVITYADIISLNVSLHNSKEYSTMHLLDSNLIAQIPSGSLIINTSRGAVIDNIAILDALSRGKLINLILDVWENEPNILLPLLKNTVFGTPHIAGHSIEGKIRGAIKIFNELNSFLGISKNIKSTNFLVFPQLSEIIFNGVLHQKDLMNLTNVVYDIRIDDYQFKSIAHISGSFDKFRSYYKIRREWSSMKIKCDNINTANLLNKIGFHAYII
uniref:Erythronate-4-phosphate dehydrogenase n=1 Tax=Candidatus Aschnera chinzeii TaxID=1485666 RepID=A0AAT9G5A8_9ENTR|nr:MAG: 4-phosphoerythronate dehydrogenase PdxB [Candidatus Aschnera chinzeii]